MKRLLPLILLLLLLTAARAEEARNITARCHLSSAHNSAAVRDAYDGDDYSVWGCPGSVALRFTVPQGETVRGVYLKWGQEVLPWHIVREEDGSTALQGGTSGYAHEYAPCELNAGGYLLQLTAPKEDDRLRIREIALYTGGELPRTVQVWQPAPDKVDLLVLPTHPDDELLYFGGTLPRYAGEEKKTVLVAYATYSSYVRRTELLNALWHCGVRLYPVLGPFEDLKRDTAEEMYTLWGQDALLTYYTDLIRACRPEVIVTHDLNGEYGHGAHKAVATTVLRAVTAPVPGPEAPCSQAPWQVKKLYFHLYDNQSRLMDWSVPLSAFDGKTAYKVAAAAYKFHVTQQNAFTMKPDGRYSCRRFGLAFSAVGDDVRMDDFFENIP